MPSTLSTSFLSEWCVFVSNHTLYNERLIAHFKRFQCDFVKLLKIIVKGLLLRTTSDKEQKE